MSTDLLSRLLSMTVSTANVCLIVSLLSDMFELTVVDVAVASPVPSAILATFCSSSNVSLPSSSSSAPVNVKDVCIGLLKVGHQLKR